MNKKNQKPNKHVQMLPHETFECVAKASTVDKRIKILQENATFALKTILQVNFRDDITFDFPEGKPPYKPDEMTVPGFQLRSIEKGIKLLKNCVSQNTKIPNIKKESIFIRLLESVHPKDAEILIAMKDKDLKSLYKGLTLATVKKAFPTLNI